MGEKENKPFQLSFNGLLKVDFQGSRVTSDGGLILVRELDERLGLGKLIDEHLTDSRQGTDLATAELRDRDAGERRELAGADGCEPRVGGASRDARRLRARRSRHGLDRKPCPRPARGQRLQRPFRVGLLSPAVAVQPIRRLPGGKAAAGQRAQRQGLERVAAARDRAPTGCGQTGHLPGRCGLCQAGNL